MNTAIYDFLRARDHDDRWSALIKRTRPVGPVSIKNDYMLIIRDETILEGTGFVKLVVNIDNISLTREEIDAIAREQYQFVPAFCGFHAQAMVCPDDATCVLMSIHLDASTGIRPLFQ